MKHPSQTSGSMFDMGYLWEFIDDAWTAMWEWDLWQIISNNALLETLGWVVVKGIEDYTQAQKRGIKIIKAIMVQLWLNVWWFINLENFKLLDKAQLDCSMQEKY